MVPVDTETNINLKIATQKTEVIYQFHNVMKDTITLWFRNVWFCNLFSRRLLTWNSEYYKKVHFLRLFFEYINALDRKNQWALFGKLKENPYQKYIYIYIKYIYILYIDIYIIYIYSSGKGSLSAFQRVLNDSCDRRKYNLFSTQSFILPIFS